MPRAETVALVAAFTSLAVGSDFALAGIYNVKLVFALTFVAAFLFGFRIGSYVGVLSEIVWGSVSPSGFGGYIIPFLAGGMLLYSAAGSLAARVWRREVRRLAPGSLYLGAMMAISAFLWDFETNIGTALLVYGPSMTLQQMLSVQVYGAPFMVVHELSDFLFGASLVPLLIFYLSRLSFVRRALRKSILLSREGDQAGTAKASEETAQLLSSPS